MNAHVRSASVIVALLFGVVFSVIAADQPQAKELIVPRQQRKAAPEFRLTDSSGKNASLEEYRGKVLVLDFWATWCTGCKHEIPWFSEYQKKYGARGFAMTGVAMDDGGWKIVKPFLSKNPIPYRMLLGNEAIWNAYGLQGLPDTFVIDRQGRISMAYRARLVDREELDRSISALLEEK